MPAWSEEIAAMFVHCGEERHLALDQLQLQGLVYVAHGWRLATSEEPLTGDRPIVTDLGPEYERIARTLHGRGLNTVSPHDLPAIDPSILDQDEVELIISVLDTHGTLNASQLATFSRGDDSPWSRRVASSVGREIGHDEIRRQFEAYSSRKGDRAGPAGT